MGWHSCLSWYIPAKVNHSSWKYIKVKAISFNCCYVNSEFRKSIKKFLLLGTVRLKSLKSKHKVKNSTEIGNIFLYALWFAVIKGTLGGFWTFLWFYLGGSQTRVAGIEFQLHTSWPPWLPFHQSTVFYIKWLPNSLCLIYFHCLISLH